MCQDLDAAELDSLKDESLYDLLAEWDEGRARGKEPTPEDLCPDDPVLREVLRRKIAAQKWLESRLGLDRTDAAGLKSGGASPPPEIPGIVIEDEIGRGAMGVVYRGRQLALGRLVAVKVLSAEAIDSAEKVHRFRKEARAVARLHHPNIVAAYDAGKAGDAHFLVMEYVEGEDLSSLVNRRGPLPIAEALGYLAQAARALDYAHAQGIIHRDVKPSNLMWSPDGTIKLLDLGLASIRSGRSADESRTVQELTAERAFLGTALYTSPEQAMDARSADSRSDIYSLGCTLHFLLTGRPPYHEDNLMKTVMAHKQSPIPSLRQSRPEASDWLDATFRKMMAKEPAERFVSMKVLVHEIDEDPYPVATNPERSGVEDRPTAKCPCNLDLGNSLPPPLAPEPGVPLAVEKVVRKPLNKRPQDRNASAADFISDLDATFTGEPTTATKFSRKRSWALAGVVLPLAVALTVVSWLGWSHSLTVVSWLGWSQSSPARKKTDHPRLAAGATTKNSIGRDLVLVPDGVFLMGTSRAEYVNEEGPEHRVRISKPFLIGAHEVTQGQYRTVMGTNPSYFAPGGEGAEQVRGEDTSRLPVESVSWGDAITFCNALSRREGLPPYYEIIDLARGEVRTLGGTGYRLPTEAEWEYACRAGTTGRYCFGDTDDYIEAERRLSEYSWHSGNSGGRTHEVGQRRPNAFDLYDMNGNVNEWVWDSYAPDYYRRLPMTDPQGPDQEPRAKVVNRIYRSGAFDSDVKWQRNTARTHTGPRLQSENLGFRVVRNPPLVERAETPAQ